MIWRGICCLGCGTTLAFARREPLLSVTVVKIVGPTARHLNRVMARRKGPQLSLLKKAIVEQFPLDAFTTPKVLIGTYGSDALAPLALAHAKKEHAALVVCFIREVNLSIRWDQPLTIETDLAAQRTFARFLDLGHQSGVPVIPVYDMGPNAAELIAENAAIQGCSKVLIGTSRHGALYHLVKGHFQTRLEALLPPDIPVEVVTSPAAAPAAAVEASVHTTAE